MMQPSGRAMHNGKIYELWGDQLWEYSPDVETGETTVRVVGQVGNPPITDSLRDAAPDLLAACKAMLANYGSIYGSDMDRPVKYGSCLGPPPPKPKGISTPTGNPKYPDSATRLLRGFRLAA